MSTRNIPIGTVAVLNGKKVRWAGSDYQWQSPASFAKLEQSNEFKVGGAILNRLGRAAAPAVNAVQGFQKKVREATPWLDPVEKAVDRAARGDDKLPSSVVARGGAVAAQRAGNAANLDPRLAAAIPFLLGSVRVGGVDDAAKNFDDGIQQARANRAAERGVRPSSPRALTPIQAPPRATASNPPRVDIQPGVPGPRPPRRLPEDSQARIAAQRAASRGDPLSRGRAEAAAQPGPYPNSGFNPPPKIGQGIDPKGNLAGTIRPQLGPVRPDPIDAPRQLRLENVDPRFSGRAEQRNAFPRSDYGPHQRTDATNSLDPKFLAEGRRQSQVERGQHRLNRANDRIRIQGGKPIGGRPPTREELVRLRRLEAQGKLDIAPESYRSTGNPRANAFDDGGDYAGDRFTDTGGFDAAQRPRDSGPQNPGFSIQQSRNTGEGSGQRGATPPIRTHFDVKRLRKDLEKAGVDLSRVDNYRHLTPEDQKRIREQVGSVVRNYRHEVHGARVPFKSGDSTLNEQVKKFLEEKRFPQQFNQIEAQSNGAGYTKQLPTQDVRDGKTYSTVGEVDRRRGQVLEGGVELPTRGSGGAVDPGRAVLGPRIKSKADAKRSDNVVGGRLVPQTAVEQARREAISTRRLSRTRGDVDWKTNVDPERLKTVGRDRTRDPRRPAGTATSPAEGAFQDQLKRQAAQEVRTQAAAIFNHPLPATMGDAIKQLQAHHGKAKTERILNHVVWSSNDGTEVYTVRDRLRDLIEKQSKGLSFANGDRGVSRSAKPIDSVGPVDVGAKVPGRNVNANSSANKADYIHNLRAVTRGPRGGKRVAKDPKVKGPEAERQKVREQRKSEQIRSGSNVEFRHTPSESFREHIQGPRADHLRNRPALNTAAPVSTTNAGIRGSRLNRANRRAEANPSSAERVRAWEAAAGVQDFKGTSMEWEGPTFSPRNAAEARAAALSSQGKINVDDGILYSDFKADGEIRNLGTARVDKYGNPKPTPAPENRSGERSRVRSENSKRRNERIQQALTEPAEFAQKLVKELAEMQRIRAARAKRRSGR
jgi:hypothetical protein